jgi:hypothetical protein
MWHMTTGRRSFLQQALMTGGLISLLESGANRSAFAQQIMAAAAGTDTPTGLGPAIGQHDSQKFWDSFGEASVAPADAPSGVHGRGLLRKNSAAEHTAGDINRQIDFFHYHVDPKTKESHLRLATSIDANELMEHEGDIQAAVNVNGFRMAGDDRDTFDKLQSAQLRIDVLQNRSMMDYMDPMAWMSLAALFPDKRGKLPPLQNLSFDPASTGDKMQQIVLPGGSAQMAVNLSMAHKDSTFLSVIKIMTTEVDKFSPVLGLPAISVTALKGFCSLYGAMEQKTTFLLNSMPVRAFATQLARQDAQTQQGMNMVAGDYVLVPHSYTEQLVPYLDKLEMRQGYLVPKGSPSTTSVYDLAVQVKPDITYLSASFSLKPFVPTSSGKSSSPSSQISGATVFGTGSSGSGSSGAASASSRSGSSASAKKGTGK